MHGSEIASALLAQHPISVGQLQDVTLRLQHVSVLPGCRWHGCCRLFSPIKKYRGKELGLPPLSCCREDIRALIWVQSSPATPARAARLCALFLPLPNSDSAAHNSGFFLPARSGLRAARCAAAPACCQRHRRGDSTAYSHVNERRSQGAAAVLAVNTATERSSFSSTSRALLQP